MNLHTSALLRSNILNGTVFREPILVRQRDGGRGMRLKVGPVVRLRA